MKKSFWKSKWLIIWAVVLIAACCLLGFWYKQTHKSQERLRIEACARADKANEVETRDSLMRGIGIDDETCMMNVPEDKVTR